MREMWIIASIAMTPALLVAIAATARGAVGGRLLSIQAASTLAVYLLACLTFALDQPSSIDLSLTLALITLPGTILFALFLERWL